MQIERWLAPDRILLGAEAGDVYEVAQAAAAAIGTATGVAAADLERALHECIKAGGFAVGAGVAIPHAEHDDIETAIGALVVTRKPLDVGALDREPADIFFVVVAQPNDPTGHLRLLADVSVLSQSRLLRSALRRASSAQEAWDVLEAAALRQTIAPTAPAPTPPTEATPRRAGARHYLAMVSISGEQVVDSLLVELIAHGFETGSVIEAQALKDAAASEVPLFAGFREIFGDPGGRRVFLFEIDQARTDWLLEVVRRTCEQRQAAVASVALMPLELRWRWQPAQPERDEKPASGH